MVYPCLSAGLMSWMNASASTRGAWLTPLAQLQPPPLIYTHSAFDPEGQKLIFREKISDIGARVFAA